MIPPIEPIINKPQPIFKSQVKTLFKKGKLPSVKYGLYGDIIDINNVTDEHIIPKSWGGSSSDDNIALASRAKNNRRGNRPIGRFITNELVQNYTDQFVGVNLPEYGFKGNRYINNLLTTLNKALNIERCFEK